MNLFIYRRIIYIGAFRAPTDRLFSLPLSLSLSTNSSSSAYTEAVRARVDRTYSRASEARN